MPAATSVPRSPRVLGRARARPSPDRGRSGQPRRRWRNWLNRNRRLAVALLLCAAIGLAVQQLTPAPALTQAVLAAARDLPAGQTLTLADVMEVHFPQELLPAGSFSNSSALEGKQLAAPVRKGQLFADSQLLGPGLLAGSPAGSAAVPLRLADPSSIRLLSAGQLINVVLTGGNGFEQRAPSQVLAEQVPVLWTSSGGGAPGQWLDAGDPDGLIVVAANAEQARSLAGSSTQGKLFFVLVGPVAG